MEEATNPTTKRDLRLIFCAHWWLAFGVALGSSQKDLLGSFGSVIGILLGWHKHHVQMISRHTKTCVYSGGFETRIEYSTTLSTGSRRAQPFDLDILGVIYNWLVDQPPVSTNLIILLK